MSLVHDALQKAAREKQRRTGQEVPSVSVTSPPPAAVLRPVVPAPVVPPAPVAPARGPTLLLAGAVASVAVVGIVAIVWLVSRSGGPVPAPAITPVAVTPAGAPAAEPAALPRPKEEPAPTPLSADAAPEFKLTGIMKDPDGAFAAVLNGRVVYEGHYVDGATVKRIERDRLVIEVQGRESTLRLF